jgi:hypothetical protein
MAVFYRQSQTSRSKSSTRNGWKKYEGAAILTRVGLYIRYNCLKGALCRCRSLRTRKTVPSLTDGFIQNEVRQQYASRPNNTFDIPH